MFLDYKDYNNGDGKPTFEHPSIKKLPHQKRFTNEDLINYIKYNYDWATYAYMEGDSSNVMSHELHCPVYQAKHFIYEILEEGCACWFDANWVPSKNQKNQIYHYAKRMRKLVSKVKAEALLKNPENLPEKR